MAKVRSRTRRAAAVAFAAAGALAVPAALAAADTITVTSNSHSLPVQTNNGYAAACGPAADIEAMSMALRVLVGIGNVALYTGPGRTGDGCDVITGNGRPIGTDFHMMGMTAANVDNQSDEPVAVYSDTTDNQAAIVPPGQDVDFTPAAVNFAFYPAGTTAPPDDRGLIPTAVFHFKLPTA